MFHLGFHQLEEALSKSGGQHLDCWSSDIDLVDHRGYHRGHHRGNDIIIDNHRSYHRDNHCGHHRGHHRGHH